MHIVDQSWNCSIKFMIDLGICVFITNTGDVATATATANKSNLLELVSNPTESTQLQMELVIIVDAEDILLKQHGILKMSL